MTYGNLAYKYDNLARVEKEEEKIREQQKLVNRKLKIKEQRRLNFFMICAIVLLSVAAYFMLAKSAQVHSTADEIVSKQKELAMLESTTSQKIFELEQSVDLNMVEQIASSKLNMQRPEKHQVIYINVQTDDVTEVTADEKEGVKSRIGSMTNKYFGIFDLGKK